MDLTVEELCDGVTFVGAVVILLARCRVRTVVYWFGRVGVATANLLFSTLPLNVEAAAQVNKSCTVSVYDATVTMCIDDAFLVNMTLIVYIVRLPGCSWDFTANVVSFVTRRVWGITPEV